MYDPVARHKAIEKLVVRQAGSVQERKYWRFRYGRWYGGIVTADAIGCGLFCKFCWVSDPIMFGPAETGEFYKPEKVAKILVGMAKRRGLDKVRVSGAEPTIGREHLLNLLRHFEGSGLLFILETNGILLGFDKSYARALRDMPFLHVRVSIKGCSEEEFSYLTGAKAEGFKLQLDALKNLIDYGVSCHPAVMASFSKEEALLQLSERLREIDDKLAENLEIEYVILYPNVKRKISRYNLKYYRAYTPEGLLIELEGNGNGT
ncbi:molybdenum cofactor biosynthesis protein MoaA [Candidatus Bathyarchaeota archaeon]|nr:MAG: molybdenum cofactor biosynthesis protein MoaA [Candidatus Bathyarchaeota archaeon]